MPKLLSLNGDLASPLAGPLAAGPHRSPVAPAGNGSPNGLPNGLPNGSRVEAHDATAAAPQLVDAENWTPQCRKGVRVAVDQPLEERFLEADRIAIEFPAFNDGRGLSLAVLLRSRYGYAGDIMATGDVHEDMLHYMRRCGFTSFLVPDGRNLETAVATLAPYSDYYQASVIEPQPAFRRIGRGA